MFKRKDLASLAALFLAGLAALSVACATSPITYARRDYQQYPAHRGEIAFYNIQQIAADVCNLQYAVNKGSFYCGQLVHCAKRVVGPDCRVSEHEWMAGAAHSYVDFHYYLLNYVQETDNVVEVCDAAECDLIYTRDEAQAKGLAEALRIYAEHSKTH